MTIIGAVIIGGAGLIGSGVSGYFANQAAKAQSGAISNAAGNVLAGQNKAISTIQSLVGPYTKVGTDILPTLESLLTPGPSQNATLSQLPGFQFAKSIAGDTISAGAGRTGISGSTAVAGGELGSQLASQYFTQFTNPLLDLYGQGQSAATGAASAIGGLQSGTGSTLGQLALGQGNVSAGLYGALGGQASGLGNTALTALLAGKYLGGGLNANPNNPLATNTPVSPFQYANNPFAPQQA